MPTDQQHIEQIITTLSLRLCLDGLLAAVVAPERVPEDLPDPDIPPQPVDDNEDDAIPEENA